MNGDQQQFAADPSPDQRPSLTRELIVGLLSRGQSEDGRAVVDQCHHWLQQPAVGGQPGEDLWLLLVTFFSSEAHGLGVDRAALVDQIMTEAVQSGRPLAQSLAHSCRAVTLAGAGHSAMSFPDLSAATVLLEQHRLISGGPSTDPVTVLWETYLALCAANSLALALMRYGLRTHALQWLEQVRGLSGLGIEAIPGRFLACFNEGWVLLNEALDVDLDGHLDAARELYRRSSAAFTAASELPTDGLEVAPLAPPASRLALATRSLAGDVEATDPLAGDPAAAQRLRPDHHAIVSLAHAQRLSRAGEFDRALSTLDQARDRLPANHRLGPLHVRILSERVIAIRRGAPPADSELAQRQLLDLLRADRRSEHDSRSAAYQAGVDAERERRALVDTGSRVLVDALTGLGNRRMLDGPVVDLLLQARADGAAVTVAFIDLDRFKDVNDRHSHPLGDLVLCEFADRLQAGLTDREVALRYGGDEFVVITADRSAADLTDVLNQLRRDLLRWSESHPRLGMAISFSAGVVTGPPASSAAELILAADQMMLEVKRSGRGAVSLLIVSPH